MCPTPLGRVQTRWAIIIVPAIIAAIVSLITSNEGWIVLIGVYFVIGTLLDTIFYPSIIRWQPPWLTFALTVGEFVLVYVAAHWLKVSLTNAEAVIEFWVAWTLAIWIKVAILPLLSLGWVENAGEFRQTGWSVSPDYTPLAVTAFQPPSDGKTPALVREFSSVQSVPAELKNLPSPSAVQRAPVLPSG